MNEETGIPKIIPSGSQDNLVKEAGTMIRVYESRRHIKQAASPLFSRSDLEEYAPPPGKFLSHMITMGSFENYGENRNCLFAGEPVRTPDGFRPIEELKEGDLVLTHKGRYREVVDTMRRLFEGTAVTLKMQGLAKTFRCTEDHPVLVLRKEAVLPEVLYKRKPGENTRPGPGKALATFMEAAAGAGFVPASSVRPGDYVLVPAEGGSALAAPPTDAWALGVFVAEGCTYREYRELSTVGESKGIMFVMGDHDDEAVIPRLMEIVESHGNRTSPQRSPSSESGRRLQWANKEVAEYCDRVFGKLATRKTLGQEVFEFSEVDKLKLLAGWADGDGCRISSDDKYDGTLTISSASFDLVSSGQRLLATLGIPSSVCEGTNRQENGCFGTRDLPIYHLSVPASHSDQILVYCARLKPHGRAIKPLFCSKPGSQGAWYRVSKVSAGEVVEPCFNIEVEEDHSFAGVIATHNCDGWRHEQLLRKHATFETHARNYREHRNTDPSLAVGEIKCARYHPKIQRGEILMWTDIDKAAAEFEKARRGEEQSGSMAARVREDVCMACGFVSTRPNERCDCIALTPGAWIPEKRAYAVMDNIDPTFKDYSWVRRPADRIAHYLNYVLPGDHQLKAASSGRELRGDELAEAYGVRFDPLREKLASIACYDDPSTIENPAEAAFVNHVVPFVLRDHMSGRILDKMAAADPGKVMRELVDRKMVLPLADFHAWISGGALRTSEIDPVVKGASEKMAGIRAIIIRRLDSVPGFSDDLRSAVSMFNPALPGCGCSSGDEITGFFDKVRDQFSTRYEVLSKSAAVNVSRGMPKRLISTAAPTGEELALGFLYNAYLLKTASFLGSDRAALAVLSGAR